MTPGQGPLVGEVNPDEAWQILSEDSSARLIDVRTRAEWSFVGVPDTGELGGQPFFIEWAAYPGMSVNGDFAAEVAEAVGPVQPDDTLLFICRSGVRSLSAARAVAAHYAERGLELNCLNVAEGFEGDLNARGHRGNQNGWKARGLAWRQS